MMCYFFCVFSFATLFKRLRKHTETHTHSAVDEDSEQLAGQRLQQLSVVELVQCVFQLQNVVFQNVSQEALVR